MVAEEEPLQLPQAWSGFVTACVYVMGANMQTPRLLLAVAAVPAVVEAQADSKQLRDAVVSFGLACSVLVFRLDHPAGSACLE